MNAVTTSPHDFFQDTGGGGSDSDTNSDELPEYYQPISAEADDEELEFSDDNDDEDDHQSDFHHHLPNGYAHCVENGVSSLDLSDEGAEDEDEEEEEEEEERTRAESDVAIRRAFRDDESRRNAPLTAENAVRVMDAMRGVSFGGLPPDWAGRIPEDRWIDQVRRLRSPPPDS